MYRLVFPLFFLFWLAHPATAQMDTLVHRYQEYLFRTHTPKEERVEEWVNKLTEKGQWPDIDYDDNAPAGWKVAQHLGRVWDMALAWSHPRSSLHGEGDLRIAMGKALDHWLEKRYQSTNWWHNQIGTPRLMRDIIILFRKGLDDEQLRQSLEVMAQLSVEEDYVGANLIWCADLGLHYGALTGDKALAERCRKLILKEIKIGEGEGVQPDYSFHQHGKRLQMYQYGEAFLVETVRIAWQFRETAWEFPKEKIDIPVDLALEGWQWMARGIHTVPGTMDRSATRVGELRNADLRLLIPFIIELQPEKRSALEEMSRIQNGIGSLEGFRYFPRSDFSAYHRPDFSFFLKTISTRTYPTESINRENLKGKLLHSGDAYLIRNGEEYYNLMPVWDWQALPGITAFTGADIIDRRSFAGSVGNGKSGVTAMDYKLTSESKNQQLSARKFWGCHKDVVVCLVADIKSENISDIYTSFDQARWQGDVTINTPGNVIDQGIHELAEVKWIHHSGFAYIPLQRSHIRLHLKEVSGTWASVNASIERDTVTEKIFQPVWLHNPTEQGKSGGYVLAYSETAKGAEKLSKKPFWEVLRNDKDCQAVRFDDGVIMVAFFSPAKLTLKKGKSLEVDNPCLVLIDGETIHVSDPSQQGLTVELVLNGQPHKAELSANGLPEQIPLNKK